MAPLTNTENLFREPILKKISEKWFIDSVIKVIDELIFDDDPSIFDKWKDVKAGIKTKKR